MVPLPVDHGYLCLELEGLQELGYKESVDNGNALANEEGSLLPKDRMGVGY